MFLYNPCVHGTNIWAHANWIVFLFHNIQVVISEYDNNF